MHRASSRAMMKQLAEEFHLPLDVIKIITTSQFRFVAKIISETNAEAEEYNNVYLRNFGRFVVTRLKRKKTKEFILDNKDVVFIDDTLDEDNGTTNNGQQ